MWKLKTAEGEDGPYLYSTNNYVGRQTWEFDPQAGTPQERDEVEAARQNFYKHRHEIKPSADLLWRFQVYIHICQLNYIYRIAIRNKNVN